MAHLMSHEFLRERLIAIQKDEIRSPGKVRVIAERYYFAAVPRLNRTTPAVLAAAAGSTRTATLVQPPER